MCVAVVQLTGQPFVFGIFAAVEAFRIGLRHTLVTAFFSIFVRLAFLGGATDPLHTRTRLLEPMDLAAIGFDVTLRGRRGGNAHDCILPLIN